MLRLLPTYDTVFFGRKLWQLRLYFQDRRSRFLTRSARKGGCFSLKWAAARQLPRLMYVCLALEPAQDSTVIDISDIHRFAFEPFSLELNDLIPA